MKQALRSILIGFAAFALAATTAHSAVTYTTAVKTARMNAVITQIDAGGAAGKLEIGTSAMASTLCTVTLNYNPVGSVTSGVLTLSGFPKTCTAAASGTAAAARIRTSGNTDIITGLTVGTSGTDIVLDSTSITSGQTVTLTTMTFTHASLLRVLPYRYAKAANDPAFYFALAAD